MRNTTVMGLTALMTMSLAAAPSWADDPAPTPSTSAQVKSATPKGGRPVVDKALEAAKKAKETGKRVEVPSHFSENTKV